MVLNGRYKVEESVGAGGEAQIFRALDLVTGSDVAVRLSPAGEAAVLPQRMPEPHAGWVRMLNRGVDPKQGGYTVFELLRGETLGAMVACGPLSAAAWLDFVRQSLDAVEALHRAGWVHGDLNADNFFFDAGATWKLLELPFHQPPQTGKRSALFGSIFTLAPEQFGGQAPDGCSDLYALGCLYYYAACGGFPHGGRSEAEIAVGRLRFPAEPLHERAPALSDQMAVWVMRLLKRDPADRPASVGAARQLLEEKPQPPLT